MQTCKLDCVADVFVRQAGQERMSDNYVCLVEVNRQLCFAFLFQRSDYIADYPHTGSSWKTSEFVQPSLKYRRVCRYLFRSCKQLQHKVCVFLRCLDDSSVCDRTAIIAHTRCTAIVSAHIAHDIGPQRTDAYENERSMPMPGASCIATGKQSLHRGVPIIPVIGAISANNVRRVIIWCMRCCCADMPITAGGRREQTRVHKWRPGQEQLTPPCSRVVSIAIKDICAHASTSKQCHC